MQPQVIHTSQIDKLRQHIILNKGKKLQFENYIQIICEVSTKLQNSDDFLDQWLQNLQVPEISFPEQISNTLQKAIRDPQQHWLEQINEPDFKQYMSFPASCLNHAQRKSIKSIKTPSDFREYYQTITSDFLKSKHEITTKEAVTTRLAIQILSYQSPGQSINYLHSKLKKHQFGKSMSGQNFAYFLKVVWLLMTPIEQFFILSFRKAKTQLPYGSSITNSYNNISNDDSVLTTNALKVIKTSPYNMNRSASQPSSPSLSQHRQPYLNQTVQDQNNDKGRIIQSLLSLVKSSQKGNNSLSLSNSNSSTSPTSLTSKYSFLSSGISSINVFNEIQYYTYFDNYNFEHFSQSELFMLQEKFFKQLYGINRGQERYELAQYLALVLEYIKNTVNSYTQYVKSHNNAKSFAAFCAVSRIIIYIYNRYNKTIFSYFDEIPAQFKQLIAETYVNFIVFYNQHHNLVYNHRNNSQINKVTPTHINVSQSIGNTEYQVALIYDFDRFVEQQRSSPVDAQIVFEAIIIKLHDLQILTMQAIPPQLKKDIRHLFYDIKQQNLSEEVQKLIYKKEFRTTQLLDVLEQDGSRQNSYRNKHQNQVFSTVNVILLCLSATIAIAAVAFDEEHLYFANLLSFPITRLLLLLLNMLKTCIDAAATTIDLFKEKLQEQ